MIKKETLDVGGEEVTVDPENMRFNEATLSEYLKKEGGWYDNFGGYLARAEKILQICENEYDARFNYKFYEYKADGGSDKFAEARAKIDSDVQDAKKAAVEAKYLVSRLKNHLRAWDRNHDNAQSLGYNLRKEMGLYNNDIRHFDGQNSDSSYHVMDEIDKVVAPIE
jgi:hypothetical protein